MASGTMTVYDISLIETQVVNSEEVPDDYFGPKKRWIISMPLSAVEAIPLTAKDSVKLMGFGEQ